MHAIMKEKGWTLEFIADGSDSFKVMLANFAKDVNQVIGDYTVRIPFGITKAMGSYLQGKVKSTLEDYLTKITTGEGLSGCVFQKYVKTAVHPGFGSIRAEIRFEESRHDDEIEVEGVVFKDHGEETTERSNIYFREKVFRRKTSSSPPETPLEYKRTVSEYTKSIRNFIDETYFSS